MVREIQTWVSEGTFKGPDGQRVVFDVEVKIDIDFVCRQLAERAAKNPSGRSSAMNGALRVQAYAQTKKEAAT